MGYLVTSEASCNCLAKSEKGAIMKCIALCGKNGARVVILAIITVAFAWAVAIAMPQPAWALVAGSAAPAQGQTFVVNGNKYKVTDAETDSDDMGEVRLVKNGGATVGCGYGAAVSGGCRVRLETDGSNARACRTDAFERRGDQR